MNQQSVADKPRGLSNFRLKVIGAALMACSLISIATLPADLSTAADLDMASLTVAVLFEAISWIAAPIYAWLLVDGKAHTSNPWAYGIRLLVLALICEVPYDLATTGQPLDWRSQNPVFALVVTLVVLSVIDWVATRPVGVRYPVIAFVVIVGVAWMLIGRIGVRQQLVNVGVLLLVCAVLMRLLRARENTMMMTVAGVGALFGVMPAFGAAVLHYRNGELGYDRPWVQWVCYAAYPVLLLVGAIL